MRHIPRLAALLSVITLAVLGAAGTAVASPAVPHPVPGAVVRHFYSDHLAGYVWAGNGLASLQDVRGTVLAPAETGAVPADTVAIGMALEQNVATGRQTYGEGLVWDDPAGCGAGTWTLEAGAAFLSSPQPVPISALSPLLFFGSDVCVAPGGSQYMEIHYAKDAGEVKFIAGAAEFGDANVLLVDHGVYRTFYTAGMGTDTTTGADAATLTLSTLASFARAGLTERIGGTFRRITFSSPSTYEFTGTVTGLAPSVANPVTLTPSGFGAGSAFTVTVP